MSKPCLFITLCKSRIDLTSIKRFGEFSEARSLNFIALLHTSVRQQRVAVIAVKAKNNDQVQSASLVKNSYQLRTSTYSSKVKAVASKSVPTRQYNVSADGSDELLITHVLERTTKTKYDN